MPQKGIQPPIICPSHHLSQIHGSVDHDHADDGDTQSDFIGDHPRLACRSELVGLELTSIDVVRVDFNEALPLFRQVLFGKDRRYGTDRQAKRR